MAPLVRPTTPRGHEVSGLSTENIRSIVRSTLTLAKSENLGRNVRFMRCALGFLMYVAAEDIPGADTVLFENSAGLSDIINNTFEEIGASRDLLMIVSC